MRVAILRLEPVVAPRSPTPMAGGSTPSESAHTHRTASSGTSTLTTAEHRRRGHFLMAPHGSVAPWGAAGGNAAVFPTQGVRFVPGPQCLFYNGARHARQGGHRALTPDQTGFERAHTAVAQPDGATACRAEGHGFESRRWRHLAVAQWKEHRPPKAGVARSNRAGEATRKASGRMRSPSRKQVRASLPWAFESPHFPLAAIVKTVMTPGSHPGSRGSSPEPRNTRRSNSGSGRRPELRASEARVAVRNRLPGGPVARTSGCYPEDEGSTPSLAAPPPGSPRSTYFSRRPERLAEAGVFRGSGRGSRRAAANATRR